MSSYFLLRTALVFLAIMGLNFVLTMLRIRKNHFRPVRMESLAEADLAPGEAATLALPAQWLEQEGFRPLGLIRQTSLPSQYTEDRWTPAALWLNQNGTIVCLARPRSHPENGVTYSLAFFSEHEHGAGLLTLNRESPLPSPEQFHMQDHYVSSERHQLDLHIAKLKNQACRIFSSAEEVTAALDTGYKALLTHLQAQGYIEVHATGFKITWQGAQRLTAQLLSHQKRLRKSPAPQPLATSVESATHTETHSLRLNLDGLKASSSSGKKGWIFIATAIAFILLARYSGFGGWTSVLALVCVLFIHEMGHFLAMKIFGYQDLSIFFLPLLGAAAKGQKDHAPAWQQIVISLAGPLPGIVLGLVLLGLRAMAPATDAITWLNAPFMTSFIWMSLAINYLNLLPITPFDGGRVVETLIFSRFPRAGFGFFALCAGLFVVGGLLTQDYVLFVLAIALGMSLPSQWRLMGVARELRPYYGSCKTEDQALAHISQALSGEKARQWPLAARLTVARALLPRLQGSLPGWKTLTLGSTIYFGTLLGPILALFLGLALSIGGTSAIGLMATLTGKHSEQYALAAVKEKYEKKLADAKTPEEKIRAYLILATFPKQDPKTVARYYQQAEALITTQNMTSLAADHFRRSYISFLYKQHPADGLAALARYQDALRTLHPEAKTQQAGLLEQEAALRSGDAPMERIALLQQALDLRANDSTEPEQRIQTRRQYAFLLWHENYPGLSEKALRTNLAEAGVSDHLAERHDEAQVDLTWLLIQTHQPEAAVHLYDGKAPARINIDDELDYEDEVSAVPPAQALASALVAAGRPGDAVNVLANALQQLQQDLKGRTELTLEVPLQLDLLHASQLAHDEPQAQRATTRIKVLMAKEHGGYLLDSLSDQSQDADNLAAPNAATQLQLLKQLGLTPDGNEQSIGTPAPNNSNTPG